MNLELDEVESPLVEQLVATVWGISKRPRRPMRCAG